MSTPVKIIWGENETTRVQVDSPARKAAAELAALSIHILVRFGDADSGVLSDLAILEGDFASDVLRKLRQVINQQSEVQGK